ncbi:MAG: DegT/DnrJ/EryC1/StrS family aminotransferase, partial [Deltaproteobacteria bacterium]|nr:DegT/DnrJ/EryC1/StrS family aminotransferase [Deltaproteobacteria bacterium]
MKVPLLDLRPPLEELRDEIIEAVTQVIDSTRYIMGPEIDSLEKKIAEYCGTVDAVGVSSGTDALLLSLMVLDVGPGDLVLTSNFSFFATAGVVVRLNATPVFVDIDPVTFNIDPEQLRLTLAKMDVGTRKRVKAIIPVHLYGQCADMKEILNIAAEFKIPVIEDSAQAIGAEYEIDGKKRQAGSLSDFGCFSFFPSKNLGGVGDGGIVTVNKPELAEQLRLKRVHGGERKYYHRVIGGNFRLDPIQATVIRVKLPHLNRWHNQRQDNAEYYNKLFAETSIGGRISIPQVMHSQRLENPHIYN